MYRRLDLGGISATLGRGVASFGLLLLALSTPVAAEGFPPFPGGKGPPEPGDPRVQEIFRIMQAARQRIKALHVEHIESPRVFGYYDDDPQRVWKSTYYWEFAFKNNSMSMRRQGPAEINSIRFERPVIYLDRGVWKKWWPSSRLAEQMTVAEEAKGKVRFERVNTYCSCLALWPYDEALPSSTLEAEFFLPYALRNPRYRLVSRKATVDNTSCCLVEREGRDQLWLDPLREYLPIKRVWRPPPEVGSKKETEVSYEFKKYRQVQPGVWLPWLVEYQYAVREGGSGGAFAKRWFNSLRVTKLQVNDEVDESLVRLEYPPGTVLYEGGFTEKSKERYSERARIFPGGEDLMDEFVARVQSVWPVQTPPESVLWQHGWAAGGLAGFAGALLTAGWLAVRAWLGRVRGQAKASPI